MAFSLTDIGLGATASFGVATAGVAASGDHRALAVGLGVATLGFAALSVRRMFNDGRGATSGLEGTRSKSNERQFDLGA